MKKIIIWITKPGSKESETKITLPIHTLNISEKLLPKKVKESLDKEGIQLSVFMNFSSQESPKGELIRIESSRETLVISVE